MTERHDDQDEARRLVEASAWRVHLTEIDAESTVEFEAWLAADPRNAQAWRRVEASWGFLGDHAAEPELLAARSTALGTTPRFGRPAVPERLSWQKIIVSAALVLVLGTWGIYEWTRPDVYQTGPGERHTLLLSDGSRLTLDSNSEVRAALWGLTRDLTLVRGQARFEVAHDPRRPFVVTAASAVVRATGTDFDVDLPPKGVVVTLIEGSVAVSDGTAHARLRAGEQWTIVPGRLPQITRVNVADALAWQGGQVVFHNAALADVVARLNRYDSVPIVLGDPSLAGMRVSGTFNTGNGAAVAEVLSPYLGLRAVNEPDGTIRLER